MMRRRSLGKTGIQVSEIAFGGVEIGMPYGIGVENEKDMLSETEAVHLLQSAVEEGMNFFDTARSYGKSETIMGKAFKEIRDQVIISTKCVPLPMDKGVLPGKKILKGIIEDSLETSLKSLQTDYVDVFMLHHTNQQILENKDIADIFNDLKNSGAVRAIGVSTYLPEETKTAIEVKAWDVIQLPFNLLDQRQKGLFDLAFQRGIAIVIRSVLFKGLLSERGRNLPLALKKVEEHIASYHQLFNKKMTNLPALATKFALSFDGISSVLVGIDRNEYLRQAVGIADGEYLNKEELAQAERSAYPEPAFLNLPYWDKMGWLK